MRIEFIPIDFDYLDVNNKEVIRIFGRTKEGKTCCIIDNAVNFFYVLGKIDGLTEKIKKLDGIERTELVNKNYSEKPVKAMRVYCRHNRIQEIADRIKALAKGNVETRERDINQITRYIIDKKFKPLIWYEIEGEAVNEKLGVDLVLKIKKINESKQHDFKPKVLAFDLETEEFEIGKGDILMISMVSDNFKKVLTWKQCKNKQSFVECYDDEEKMIRAFANYIKKINPDIITGYFSDGFDLPYLRARAEKNHVDLRLGRDNSRIIFSRGRPLNAKIKGIVHVDLLKFIETVYAQYLQSETLTLNEVASELLGEGKLEVDHKARGEEELKKYFEYNLQDSILTYKLFQKIWPDMQVMTHTIQEPLFNTARYALSGLVENYILHNLEKFNEIAERRPLHDEIQKRRMMPRPVGAFVLQPKAGLYEDIAIFDFTSMHTSILVSFNISRTTLLPKKQPNSYESPELKLGKKTTKFYFSKKKGFFSQMANEIIDLRKKYKKQYKENPNPITKARSNAFKLLSASIHGYIGFFGARYYSLESAASILALVRKFNKEAIDKTNKAGFNVIYADTDSVAFTLNKKSKKQTLDFLKKLNTQLPGVMELELEDFYKRGIWVTKRTGEFGAKKKYALLGENNKMKIRGFETVRRDWCDLAKEVQDKILRMILKDGKADKALEYAKTIIKQIKDKKAPVEKLIIKTKLTKPIDEYTAIGPHVVIAKEMLKRGIPVDAGTLIKFVVSSGKEKARIRDKAKLPEDVKAGQYDIHYYVNNQIMHAVSNIFEVFGIDTKELAEGKKQKKLGDF